MICHCELLALSETKGDEAISPDVLIGDVLIGLHT
jgi:hypothetical protein